MRPRGLLRSCLVSIVGRARRQAHAAVHALLQHGVVELLADGTAVAARHSALRGRRAATASWQGRQSKILPGFRIRCGSRVRLSAHQPEAGVAELLLQEAFFARPTPCSPVTVPPSRMASSKISAIAISTRCISSVSRLVGEEGGVQVAVAHVAEGADQQAVLAAPCPG